VGAYNPIPVHVEEKKRPGKEKRAMERGWGWAAATLIPNAATVTKLGFLTKCAKGGMSKRTG
jgi:hypothetical protein